jgi:hypothetical protein
VPEMASECGTFASLGIVRDNPALNKRIAENTALGRAGVPEVGAHPLGCGIHTGKALSAPQNTYLHLAFALAMVGLLLSICYK